MSIFVLSQETNVKGFKLRRETLKFAISKDRLDYYVENKIKEGSKVEARSPIRRLF